MLTSKDPRLHSGAFRCCRTKCVGVDHLTRTRTPDTPLMQGCGCTPVCRLAECSAHTGSGARPTYNTHNGTPAAAYLWPGGSEQRSKVWTMLPGTSTTQRTGCQRGEAAHTRHASDFKEKFLRRSDSLMHACSALQGCLAARLAAEGGHSTRTLHTDPRNDSQALLTYNSDMIIEADAPRPSEEPAQPTSSEHGGHLGVCRERLDQLSSETRLFDDKGKLL